MALAIGLFSHYPSLFPPGNDVTHAINSAIPVTRDFLSFQEFFIAGMLVALNLDRVLAFVARHYRQILVGERPGRWPRGGVVHDLGLDVAIPWPRRQISTNRALPFGAFAP